MRVLFVTMVPTSRTSKAIGLDYYDKCGWMESLIDRLEGAGNQVGICFSHSKSIGGNSDGEVFYGVKNPDREFNFIYKKFSPDIIYIFGTEYKFLYYAIMTAQNMGMIANTYIHMQGLVSIYSKHYYSNLPYSVIFGCTLRNIIKLDSVALQKLDMYKRGKFETDMITVSKNIVGRTEWDKACVTQINPDINYYHCDEVLRNSFYENAGKWSLRDCEKYSVFMSQGDYPIKGLHNMLSTMSILVKKYPNICLYISGVKPVKDGIWGKIKISRYGIYILNLIKKYNIESNVVLLGRLTEKEMCERYLKSNVFVCCSSIENSPNSLGEAMMLGVPCVTSDVGGIRSMFDDQKDGFMYPADEPYMCAYHIEKIFESPEIADRISKSASQHALQTHNRDVILEKMMDIFNKN